MKNTKKGKLISSVLGIAMMACTTLPSVSDCFTAPVVAQAYYSGTINVKRTVKANSVFRSGPSFSKPVVASVSYSTTITCTRVEVNSDGTWFYSLYDRAWIHSSRLK